MNNNQLQIYHLRTSKQMQLLLIAQSVLDTTALPALLFQGIAENEKCTRV